MDRTYWYKQSINNPLFPDLLWSRPENKRSRGKLLIIGGNSNGFMTVAESYSQSVTANIGTTRILLPNSLQKLVKGPFFHKVLENVEFSASTKSGSFGKVALGDWLEHAQWSDGVLLPGDLGRNSEVAILVESYAAKYQNRIILAQDAAEYAVKLPKLLDRDKTLLILSLAQLQKVGTNARFKTAFKLSMDLIQLVDALHEFTTEHSAYIIVKHLDRMVVAVNGQISTTEIEPTLDKWRSKAATNASVWWLQSPEKPFEAITTSQIKIAN